MSRRERVVRALGLPEDVILNIPQAEMSGNGHLHLDHYQRILEFNEELVVLQTSQGVWRVEGKDLQIRFAKSGELDIEGDLSNIQPGRR